MPTDSAPQGTERERVVHTLHSLAMHSASITDLERSALVWAADRLALLGAAPQGEMRQLASDILREVEAKADDDRLSWIEAGACDLAKAMLAGAAPAERSWVERVNDAFRVIANAPVEREDVEGVIAGLRERIDALQSLAAAPREQPGDALRRSADVMDALGPQVKGPYHDPLGINKPRTPEPPAPGETRGCLCEWTITPERSAHHAPGCRHANLAPTDEAAQPDKLKDVIGDLHRMRDFCHARHMGGVNCDAVIAEVERLITEPADEVFTRIRAKVEAARLAERLERIGYAARAFADEFELIETTQLYGRITSGEIQSATFAAARLLRTLERP